MPSFCLLQTFGFADLIFNALNVHEIEHVDATGTNISLSMFGFDLFQQLESFHVA